MPKDNIDYSNTIIYKLICKDENIKELHVGHTTNFSQRKYAHKISCEKDKNLKIYGVIRENGGWENWDMIEIEKYPCADGNEARARERYWYETLEASLNTCNPICNPNCNQKEWYEKNKERLKEYRKEWYEKNREKKKEWYEKNREKKLQKSKEYYQQKKKLSSTNI